MLIVPLKMKTLIVPYAQTLIDNPHSSTSNAPNTDELSDNVIAIGDQHNMSINGGPQVCSMLSVENPERENHIIILYCTC